MSVFRKKLTVAKLDELNKLTSEFKLPIHCIQRPEARKFVENGIILHTPFLMTIAEEYIKKYPSRLLPKILKEVSCRVDLRS
ncbi:hypothetical protein [Candidatus Ferrigenium straubiae]|jgi:hypothetical protein|uniref:hypothetical protein n=1 Tax=Candidatus Ferrigenium straubiae TaxID=2919506 RepID=UPI003F4AB181